MSDFEAYRNDILFTFQKHKGMAEKAMVQLKDDLFFFPPGQFSSSVAVIVKHLAGNLTSRWTDFLTCDGEKPTRNRDGEFVIGPDDSRDNLLALWEAGWGALFGSLRELKESDWLRTITIRGEPHSVMQAIHRSVAHVAYHTGQITYVSRMLQTGTWHWVTIPPGQSGSHPGKYLQA
ncbi:MAG TPA: DUF1572 family protein [Gemmataceae bacterium]|nr:DUF1572 family protein [Gemmataceae bacterium]